MGSLLDASKVQAMGQLLIKMKADGDIEPHLISIRRLFFGMIKDMKSDMQYEKKQECLHCLEKVLPHAMKSKFHSYFFEGISGTSGE